ncbi:MAG: chorismate synthase [Pyrinomonadaceae bacterium]
MADLKLEIVTPERRVVDETVDSVTIPTQSGEIGILPAHAPLISQLKSGILTYTRGATTNRMMVSGGFVEVGAERVSVLADVAQLAEEINTDEARAEQSALERAMSSFDGTPEEMEREREKLERAEARLQLAGGSDFGLSLQCGLWLNAKVMIFRFTTAGESHGKALVAIVEGLPAGVEINIEKLNRELWRRQQGYGRGGRMKIEADKAEILSGVRHGKTLGSPVALLIENKDWQNWTETMSVTPLEQEPEEKPRIVTRPRPGHADLAGGQKFQTRDLRDILERASARETAARVACGALAKQLLAQFAIDIKSHVAQLGNIPETPINADWQQIAAIDENSQTNCVNAEIEKQIIEKIDEARRAGDTLGGVFEVVVRNLPVGLGSHTSWREKLDGQLAQAVMSIQAVKAVEIGTGVTNANLFGSKVHDEIGYDAEGKSFTRLTNRAGGLEGGITTGEELRVRGYLKPISTLRRALKSVDIDSKEESLAAFERSDTTAVPAASVIGEAMVAIVLTNTMREKFGGDSLTEMRRNFDSYLEQLSRY